jgi:hypothetical protein
VDNFQGRLWVEIRIAHDLAFSISSLGNDSQTTGHQLASTDFAGPQY